MILSDREILEHIENGKLVIDPYNKENVGPSSYDVCIGDEFVIYDEEVYDIKKELKHKRIKIEKAIMICPLNYGLTEEKIEYLKSKYDVDYVVEGGVLGTTKEYIELPNDICAQYQGRSSFGRIFLTSHQTAGWIDAGFKGKITLEFVVFDKPVILYKDQRIGQLIFLKLSKPADIGYSERKNSKYVGQKTVMPSMIHKEFNQ